MQQTLLVLDGHDGAGKSTLAQRLGEALGAPVIRPFSGEFAARMVAQAERGDARRVASIAQESARRALAGHDEPVLICDRHWLTVFALAPETCWEPWRPGPPTTLCWANLETTLARLANRDEAHFPPAYHHYYLRRYWELGHRFGCNVLRTDQISVDACVEQLVAWARAPSGA
jgi:hypothetical protein